MAGDILYDPLGQTPDPPERPSRWWLGLTIVAVAIGGAGAGALWMEGRPARETPVVAAPAEPLAQAAIPAAPRPAPPAVVSAPAVPIVALPTPSPPAAAPLPPGPKVVSAAEIDRQSGVSISRPAGLGSAGARIIKITPEMAVSLVPAPDPRLVEKSRFGLLPRRGGDGSRPADVYSRPVVPDETLPATAPRMAIVVGGLGADAEATTGAAGLLPGAVTLAFVPSGDGLEAQVRSARDLGHETILQVPMQESAGQSGPVHRLTTTAAQGDNLDQLHWMMGRFTGYVAAGSLRGTLFTSDRAALDPVLADIAARGLFFFDDGTNPKSLATSLARDHALPVVRADMAIDGDRDAIDAGLQSLLAEARRTGAAIGFVSGGGDGAAAVTRFSAGLLGQGVRLVPLSAFATAGRPRPLDPSP